MAARLIARAFQRDLLNVMVDSGEIDQRVALGKRLLLAVNRLESAVRIVEEHLERSRPADTEEQN